MARVPRYLESSNLDLSCKSLEERTPFRPFYKQSSQSLVRSLCRPRGRLRLHRTLGRYTTCDVTEFERYHPSNVFVVDRLRPCLQRNPMHPALNAPCLRSKCPQ